jgi:hypothetical protein
MHRHQLPALLFPETSSRRLRSSRLPAQPEFQPTDR